MNKQARYENQKVIYEDLRDRNCLYQKSWILLYLFPFTTLYFLYKKLDSWDSKVSIHSIAIDSLVHTFSLLNNSNPHLFNLQKLGQKDVETHEYWQQGIDAQFCVNDYFYMCELKDDGKTLSIVETFLHMHPILWFDWMHMKKKITQLMYTN